MSQCTLTSVKQTDCIYINIQQCYMILDQLEQFQRKLPINSSLNRVVEIN